MKDVELFGLIFILVQKWILVIAASDSCFAAVASNVTNKICSGYKDCKCLLEWWCACTELRHQVPHALGLAIIISLASRRIYYRYVIGKGTRTQKLLGMTMSVLSARTLILMWRRQFLKIGLVLSVQRDIYITSPSWTFHCPAPMTGVFVGIGTVDGFSQLSLFSLSYDLSLIVSKEGLSTFGWLSNILHTLSGRHLLNGELENFFRMQAKTQQLTISQQLDNGIRFLDIRLMHEEAQWYSIHFMQSKETILTYFNQIKDWMDRHPDEVVVMWLSRHGNAQATGEEQYPNVPVQVRRELWQQLTLLFSGMLFDSKICNIFTDSIERLLINKCRVVPFVSDYVLFTGKSNFALDAVRIVNSWDKNGGIFSEAVQNQEHCTYFDQIRQHNERAKSRGLFTLRGMNSQSNRQQILSAAQQRFLGWIVNFRCKLKGMNDTKWCPDNLLDVAQLSSYYNQHVLDSAEDFPHAFYLDALDYNGTIRTGSQLLNGARQGGTLQRFAYVDTLILYNLGQVPGLPSNCSLCLQLEKRRRRYPLSLWRETSFGRYNSWPSDCFAVNSKYTSTLLSSR